MELTGGRTTFTGKFTIHTRTYFRKGPRAPRKLSPYGVLPVHQRSGDAGGRSTAPALQAPNVLPVHRHSTTSSGVGAGPRSSPRQRVRGFPPVRIYDRILHGLPEGYEHAMFSKRQHALGSPASPSGVRVPGKGGVLWPDRGSAGAL